MKVSREIMLKTLGNMWRTRKQFISLLVGVPSYETYVTHMKKHHPDESILCQKQFFRKHKRHVLMRKVAKYQGVVEEKSDSSLFFIFVVSRGTTFVLIG